ncbi:MAG: GcrA family cell cycle regulator [Janthinobacterium lividum]
MAVSPEIKAAVEAAHGKESARDLAERYGLTRNQVVGLWHRRPRDTPEELAKAEAAVATPPPFTPEAASFAGRPGMVWRALVAAGETGLTVEEGRAVLYPDGRVPSSWEVQLYATLRKLTALAEPHGYTVATVAESRPPRRRIARIGEELAPAPEVVPADELPAVDTAPVSEPTSPDVIPVEPAKPLPIAPALVAAPAAAREELAMPTGLSGAAAAVATLRRGCCRWPIGEPNDNAFRFCGEVVQDEGKPYCPEHRRAGSAGQWSARRAA